MLDGNPPQYGENQESPDFEQGQAIFLNFYLSVDGVAVTPRLYNILGTLKSSPLGDVLYEATIDNLGILPTDVPGNYRLYVPEDVTTDMVPGIYYFQIHLTERNGNKPKDRTFTALKTTLQISRSNISPAPDWRDKPAQESLPIGRDPRIG